LIPAARRPAGKLPADLNTPALVEKRAKAERIKDFSRNLRAVNANNIERVRQNTARSNVSRRPKHVRSPGPPAPSLRS